MSLPSLSTRLRQVGFTIGVIALGAKMAKVVGEVTRDEVEAFRSFFQVPPGEERNVERFFDLAKRDAAGFETYARQVARLFPDAPEILESVLDGLFDIAKADGQVSAEEAGYLAHVAEIFGLSTARFERARAAAAEMAQANENFAAEVAALRAEIAGLRATLSRAEAANENEAVRVRALAHRRGATHARIVEVLDPSPDRVVPPCAEVANGCGACPWQHLDLAAQRTAKVDRVAAALGVSSASIKRLFATQSLSLARLDEICGLLDIEFGELAEQILGTRRQRLRHLHVHVHVQHMSSHVLEYGRRSRCMRMFCGLSLQRSLFPRAGCLKSS